MPFGLTNYYILLIFIGVSLCVIVWLLWTIRSLKASSEESLKHKVLVSEKILSFLQLDVPDLKPGSVALPSGISGVSSENMEKRITHFKNTYAELKNLLDLKLFLNETRAEDVMTKKVYSLEENDSFYEVAALMKKHAVRHIPIVRTANKIVGLVTQRDLYRIASPRKLLDDTFYYDPDTLNQFILKEVMTKDVSTLRLDQPLGEAVLCMVKDDYGCLPIVDMSGSLCGILTRADILKLASLVYLSEDIGENKL